MVRNHSERKFIHLDGIEIYGVFSCGGIKGIAILTPMFISIPLGSIITAKFFTHKKWAYPSLLLAVVFWALVIGGLASFYPDLFKTIIPETNEP